MINWKLLSTIHIFAKLYSTVRYSSVSYSIVPYGTIAYHTTQDFSLYSTSQHLMVPYFTALYFIVPRSTFASLALLYLTLHFIHPKSVTPSKFMRLVFDKEMPPSSKRECYFFETMLIRGVSPIPRTK